MIANFERQSCKKPQLVVNRQISWSQAKLIGRIIFWRLCSMLQCYHVKLIGRILFCKRISGFSEDTQDGTDHSIFYHLRQYQHLNKFIVSKNLWSWICPNESGAKEGCSAVSLPQQWPMGGWVSGWVGVEQLVGEGPPTYSEHTSNIFRKKYFSFLSLDPSPIILWPSQFNTHY